MADEPKVSEPAELPDLEESGEVEDAGGALEAAFAKQVNDPEFQKTISGRINPGEKPVEKESEAKKEAAPVVAPKPAVAPPPPASLPDHLLARAVEAGLTKGDLEGLDAKVAERVVSSTERALLATFRKQQAAPKAEEKPKEEPKAEKPARPDFFKGKRESWDKATADDLEEVMGNLYDSLTEHPLLKNLVATVQHIDGFLRSQDEQAGASVVDEVCGKTLADYSDVLGDKRPAPGTVQHDARGRLTKVLAATMKSWNEQGLAFSREDLDEHAKMVARKFWGERAAKVPEELKEPKPTPPKDPVTGRFVPEPKPTVTARPSARPGSQVEEGRVAAVNAVKAEMEKMRLNGDM